ncbi:MAG: hypothetical protein ACXVH7_05595 [Thermoanaerobaculia bacterium]
MNRDEFYARTMHTPDDPVRAARRATLREISRLLLPLHRSLIEAARADFAFAYQAVDKPSQLLQLLNEHPFFAWLKPMTSLIVDIDEAARADFEPAQFQEIIRRVESLVPNGGNAEFAEHYIPLLQRDVDVAIAHAALRQALLRLANDR